MTLTLLYFASIRERIGVAREDAQPPAEVGTVAELLAWLRSRGDDYAEALAETRVVRAAIDHVHAKLETPLAGAREVAFFPPMTGG